METELEVGWFGVGDFAGAVVERADGSYADVGIQLDLSGLKPGRFETGGTFRVECIDRNGKTRWVEDAKNSLTLAALDYVLNTTLRNTTPIAQFYIGLVDNAGFTTFANTDTMASHAGWVENTQYTPSGRVAWSPGASSGQTVTNASALTFAMTPSSAATIRGVFLCADPTSSVSGILLFSTAPFGTGSQLVNSGDTIKVTYTVTASSS